MGNKTSKKAEITAPPSKDKKVKRKKSKKESANSNGIEEVSVQEKKDETTLEPTENEVKAGENGDVKKDTESAGSGDAATDIVQDSPGNEPAGVAVMSDVQSPSVLSPANEDSKDPAVPVQSPTAVVEAKIETPCTEISKTLVENEKESQPIIQISKPDSTSEEINVTSPNVEQKVEDVKVVSIEEAKVVSPVLEESKTTLVEEKVTEELKLENSLVGESKTEISVVEESKVKSPVVEEPKTESPIVEESKTEVLVAEVSKTENFVPEEPKTKSPVAEEPKTESPLEQKIESPVAEESKTENPVAEESKTESPVVEEPKAESPVVEEPKVESPVVEEPKAESPVAEEPKAESPVAEEPKAESSAVEPKIENSTVEESQVTSPVVEEQKLSSPIEESVPVTSSVEDSKLIDNSAVSESQNVVSEDLTNVSGETPQPPDDTKSELPAEISSPVSSNEIHVKEKSESSVEVLPVSEESVPSLTEAKDTSSVEETATTMNGSSTENKQIVEEQKPLENGVNGTNGVHEKEHEESQVIVQENISSDVPTLISWKNGGNQVSVSGDFNQWEDNCMLNEVDGVFSTKLKLSKGTHHFKYLVDGNWTIDENQPTVELDGHGQVNVLTVQAE